MLSRGFSIKKSIRQWESEVSVVLGKVIATGATPAIRPMIIIE